MQKYVGRKKHTKANHKKKRSQCGNDVCKGDFFFFFFTPSPLSFLSVDEETWCGVVMNCLVWAGWVTINASRGVIMVFDKCT